MTVETGPRLWIDREGDWFDGGAPVTHPGVLANLRGSLRRDTAGHFIQTRERIDVGVADTPFVVRRLERHGDRLWARLNDGTHEAVDAATLRFAEDGIPYCAVRTGRFEARLDLAAAGQLLALLDVDAEAGVGTLRLGATAHAFAFRPDGGASRVDTPRTRPVA